MRTPARILLVSLLLPMAAVAADETAPSAADNPLLRAWDTPFGVPPFDQIDDDAFLPAYREAMAQNRAEAARIATSPEPPTFANTIVALDRAGMTLERVDAVFSNLNSADTNERRQAVAKETAPLLAALEDDIRLDPALFARIEAIWDARAQLALDPLQARLLERTRLDFVRGGAALPPAQRERLRAINQELATLSVAFSDHLLAETNGWKLVIDNPADLAGLSERLVQSAAETAKKAGLEGRWVFTLQWPSIWPFMEAADNRALRQQLLAAYERRCANGNENDNRALLARVVALRTERAHLLGYASHADFVLADRMAKTPAAVAGLMDQVWKPALAVAAREAADLQAQIDAAHGGFKLEAADWRYYTEKLRKERFDFDDAAVRPYLQLERVRDGAFMVAHRLYGLTFTRRTDLPVYNPEVQVFEVKDADGSFIGIFYVDYFPRPGKRGGAWSSRFRSQYVDATGRDVRPVVVNVCNFSRPAGDAPALLSLEETTTLFHEFGHALHALLQQVPYRRLAEVPRDFVELPSQVMENWAVEPAVLAEYARHYQTGAPMPQELIAKIVAARKFNQGFETTEYLAAAWLDMAWHTQTTTAEPDVGEFERATLARLGLPPVIPPRYHTPYFLHIFSHDYSAGYYSYLWAEVLDADAFEAFKEKGLFDPATARAFRSNVLERGGTADAMELYKTFRGREPSVGPLLERRGLN